MPTIYVSLLNEGVVVWRPVEATKLAAETYRIEGEVPEGEEWEFAPGYIVNCGWKDTGDGKSVLIAVAAAD